MGSPHREMFLEFFRETFLPFQGFLIRAPHFWGRTLDLFWASIFRHKRRTLDRWTPHLVLSDRFVYPPP